jgi:hypothetical protein
MNRAESDESMSIGRVRGGESVQEDGEESGGGRGLQVRRGGPEYAPERPASHLLS